MTTGANSTISITTSTSTISSATSGKAISFEPFHDDTRPFISDLLAKNATAIQAAAGVRDEYYHGSEKTASTARRG